MEIKLKKFNMDMFKNKDRSILMNHIVLIIGESEALEENKQKLIKEILEYHNEIKDGLIITGGEKKIYEKYSEDIVKNESVEYMDSNEPESSNRTEELIKEFMKKQKDLKKRIINGEKELDNRRFLIMDNCKDNHKIILKDKNIREIFMNGRTYGVFFIISTDKIKEIPPNLRANIDFIFLFEEKSNKKKKILYENYAGMITTFNMFNILFDECTKENGCLMINNCSPSPKLEYQIFWYKSDIE